MPESKAMTLPNWKTAALAFEQEANQSYCEVLLLRGECIRLRNLNALLSTFIETSLPVEQVPVEVMNALDAIFPEAVAEVVEDPGCTAMQLSENDHHQAVTALALVAKLLNRADVRVDWNG